MKWIHLCAAALLCTAASAQSLTGTWTGPATTADNGLEMKIALTQEGGKITGYVLSPRSTDTIVDGKVEGANVTLEAERPGRNGTQKVTYTAVLEGDKLKVTMPMFGGRGSWQGRGPGRRPRRRAPGRYAAAPPAGVRVVPHFDGRAGASASRTRADYPAHARPRPLQRPRQDAAHGLEQLEQVPQPGERQDGARNRRRHGPHRHARRRLHLCQHRRHLGSRQPRRPGQHPDQQQIPRHEGAGRLRPQQGPEARHLFLARPQDLRRLSRQLPARGAGRQDVRRVGNRLPEVRLVQRARVYDETQATMAAAYAKMGQALLDSGRPIVYSLCQYGMQRRGRMGRQRGRQPVAHHRRHQRPLAIDVEHRVQPAAGPREISPGRDTGTIPTCSRSATAA